jgi:hypothetical protein
MPLELNEYERLKKTILDIGLVIPGTLRESFHQCGKSYCACMKSKKNRHGPYYLWDRRVQGKLTAKSIAVEDIETYKEWINNRKKLEQTIALLIDFGCHYATSLQDLKKLKAGNSIKTVQSTRGK